MSSLVDRALLALLEAIFGERIRLRTAFQYRVVGQSGMLVDAEPVDSTLGLPPVSKVPVRTLPGVSFDITPGTTCALGFLDGNAAKPFVFGFDDTQPTEIRMGDGLGAVIRSGDTVKVDGIAPAAALGIITVTLGQGSPPTESKVKA